MSQETNILYFLCLECLVINPSEVMLVYFFFSFFFIKVLHMSVSKWITFFKSLVCNKWVIHFNRWILVVSFDFKTDLFILASWCICLCHLEIGPHTARQSPDINDLDEKNTVVGQETANFPITYNPLKYGLKSYNSFMLQPTHV